MRNILLNMLPVESLVDAITFLPLYDLDSVLLANRQLSSAAYKCVKVIRAWHFEIVNIFVEENYMILYELVVDDDVDGDDARDFAVEGRENITEVLDIALRNWHRTNPNRTVCSVPTVRQYCTVRPYHPNLFVVCHKRPAQCSLHYGTIRYPNFDKTRAPLNDTYGKHNGSSLSSLIVPLSVHGRKKHFLD